MGLVIGLDHAQQPELVPLGRGDPGGYGGEQAALGVDRGVQPSRHDRQEFAQPVAGRGLGLRYSQRDPAAGRAGQ